jgi:hypothetical protein
MAQYRFNNWQKAAFGAWGLGALLIIIGVANIGSEASASTVGHHNLGTLRG